MAGRTVALSALAALAVAQTASATVHLRETFDDATWENRWVQSASKPDYGKFQLSHGKYFGDAKKDLGIQTSQDAHFYSASSKLPTPFSNAGKTLVLQYSVKHEQGIDCGGGYVKLLPSTVDGKAFDGESPYHIMFGPDICGTKRVHVIITYKGVNKLITETILPKTDVDTHVYTLVIEPDQTYRVLIDQDEVKSGSLEEHWDFLPPKQVKDPQASKPADWVDQPKIDDPEDVKPADWDDQPEFVTDASATKPEDWDDDMDGAWEAPQVPNPEFKGKWTPRRIDNPAYKGVWVHPLIDNPDYAADDSIYKFNDIGAVGFDLWQVKAGSIFDNIFVGDSLEEAKAFYAETTGATIAGEKAARKAAEEVEAARLAEEEKKREEAAAAEDEDDEDEDADDEDHDEL